MLHKVDEVRSAHESSGTTCPDLPNSSGQFGYQRPGHPISIAEAPIGLVQAFRDAMEALDDLHQGRPEAALLYKGKPVSVRYLIEVASIFFYERMPDDLYERLCVVAGYGEEPKDHTFAAGAQCLRSIYTDLRAKRRATIGTTRNAESQPVLTREVSHSRRRQLLDCYLKSPLRALGSGP